MHNNPEEDQSVAEEKQQKPTIERVGALLFGVFLLGLTVWNYCKFAEMEKTGLITSNAISVILYRTGGKFLASSVFLIPAIACFGYVIYSFRKR